MSRTGSGDSIDAQQRWDRRYRESEEQAVSASYVLQQYRHLLPADCRSAAEPMHALDLACGHGGNALMLVRAGFTTHAWDISSVVIEQLRARAQAMRLQLNAETRDVVLRPPPPASFDVIVVCRFLHRALAPALIAALKPGGVLFYQTFTVHSRSGPTSADYRLQENELLHLFSSLQVRAFEDSALCGDVHNGFRDESLIVAQKQAESS